MNHLTLKLPNRDYFNISNIRCLGWIFKKADKIDGNLEVVRNDG